MPCGGDGTEVSGGRWSIPRLRKNMLRAAAFTLIFALTNASLALLFPFGLSRFLLCFVLYATGTIFMLYLLFHPRNQWLVANRSRVNCAGRPCVALTFDDGPTAHHTPRLLEILREKKVKATFFVVGRRAESQVELVRRLHAEGHLIANHTYSHPSLFCFLTPRRLCQEIERGQEVIRGICGVRPRYFRSPVGLRHPLLNFYLQQVGLEYISWRVRAFDTLVQKPQVVMNRILHQVAPGDIILLHDNSSAGVGIMLGVLPQVIDELKDRGFDFVLV